jgi:hypothetical protein
VLFPEKGRKKERDLLKRKLDNHMNPMNFEINTDNFK